MNELNESLIVVLLSTLKTTTMNARSFSNAIRTIDELRKVQSLMAMWQSFHSIWKWVGNWNVSDEFVHVFSFNAPILSLLLPSATADSTHFKSRYFKINRRAHLSEQTWRVARTINCWKSVTTTNHLSTFELPRLTHFDHFELHFKFNHPN